MSQGFKNRAHTLRTACTLMCTWIQFLCSSARNVERCSRARGYPQKIFSDNLTNIDTNSKKNVRIFGGGSMTTKTPLFRDPCFAQFSDAQPKMTNTKPMSQNREAAPITNQPPNHRTNIFFYYKLIPWPKFGVTHWLIAWHTNSHIIQIYSQG